MRLAVEASGLERSLLLRALPSGVEVLAIGYGPFGKALLDLTQELDQFLMGGAVLASGYCLDFLSSATILGKTSPVFPCIR